MLLALWRRWVGRSRFNADSASVGQSPEEAVASIQLGNEELRNDLIQQYRPFILKTASRFSKRYIDPSRDDEYSVALTAFDEAINGYSPESGGKFLSFAAQVMTRRLIDFARKEERHAALVPFSAMESAGEDEGLSPLTRLESKEALAAYDLDREKAARREEIEALAEELAGFGIRFAELSDHSPKHHDSRKLLLGIGRRLAETPDLFALLKEKRQLPLKELCEKERVSRKTLERNRKYLIAVALIAGGPYGWLKPYIEEEEPEDKGGASE